MAVLFHYDVSFADVEILAREGFLHKKNFREADPGGSTEQRELFKKGVVDVMEGAGLPLRRRRMAKVFRRIISKDPFAAVVAPSQPSKKLRTGVSSLEGSSSSVAVDQKGSSTSGVKDASSSSSSASVRKGDSGVKKGDSSSDVKKLGSSAGAKKSAKSVAVGDASDLSGSDCGSCSGSDDDDDDVTLVSSAAGSGHRDSLSSLFSDVSTEVSSVVSRCVCFWAGGWGLLCWWLLVWAFSLGCVGACFAAESVFHPEAFFGLH